MMTNRPIAVEQRIRSLFVDHKIKVTLKEREATDANQS